MRQGNPDLHGNAPDKSPVALLLVDTINDLEFPEGSELLPQALVMARSIAQLKHRCRKYGIPCIYVNDNFGLWRSDFQAQVDHCLQDGVVGKPLVEILRPDKHDYFVLKPKHSGFFATTLDTLLTYLQSRTLLITGLTTNNCVLFTANDAYMRDYHLVVPQDCVTAFTEEDHQTGLKQIEKVLKADIRRSTEWECLEDLMEKEEEPGSGSSKGQSVL